jgi:transposase
MARYKYTDAENGQGMFLSVNLKQQLLPGTFEYMLDDLVGNTIDVSIFDKNYKNDNNGAPAIPPAALIKLIIYGYLKGMKSSRKIGELAEHNIIAKALTGDIEPHWTTIADFISGNSEKFRDVFIKVLVYCGELGLIGGQTSAIDGCRLPSNASIEMSGTKEELEKKLGTYRRMAEKHIARHRRLDERGEAGGETERRYQKRQKHLNRQIEKISGFLEGMERKGGKHTEEVKSNVTDNESAMIRSPSGFLQGYIGIAVSDKQNQIILSADAIGSANEGEHLPEILDNMLDAMEAAAVKTPEGEKLTVLMDNNYYSEENLTACRDRGVEAITPDGQYRKRLGGNNEGRYETDDFKYNEEGNYYECPNGKKLGSTRTVILGGREWHEYRASSADCRLCPLHTRCIRSGKSKSTKRMRKIMMVTKDNKAGNLCGEMRKKLNTEEYQDKYAYRIQIVEPVFASITYCKGLDRFTLRGKKKVNGQWKLYCMVHNLSKCLNGYNKNKGYT